MTLWAVKAGLNGERENYNLLNNVCTFGWSQLPNLAELGTREGIQQVIQAALAAEGSVKAGSVRIYTKHAYSFALVIEPGDLIAMPLQSQGPVMFGDVNGAYGFNANAPGHIGPHLRRVSWYRPVPRTQLSAEVLRAIRQPQTLFEIRIDHAEEQIRRILAPRE